MLSIESNNPDPRFTILYDKYSAVSFDLSLRLMDTTAEAEAVLIDVFKTVYFDRLYATNTNCMSAFLIRFTFIAASKRHLNSTIFLEKANQLPILHRLLLGNINMQNSTTGPLPNPGEHGRQLSKELKQYKLANQQDISGASAALSL